MKTLIACASFCAMLLWVVCIGVARAATPVPLQIPAVSTYNGATYRCGYSTCPVTWSNRNDLIVTGFTPEGNYLNVNVSGWVAIGIGRGYVYHYWCGTMQFNLSGNLTQINVATSKSAFAACPFADASLTFTNAGGYEGFTTLVYSQGGYFLGFAPNLDSP